jgi:predicted acetyltransferase
MLRLEVPDARYRAGYVVSVAEFRAEGRLDAMHAALFHALPNFEAFAQSLLEKTDPDRIPPGRVPETVLWLIEGDDPGEVLGRVSIRHTLNSGLLEVGGHIGYEIRPSRRRMGYGTRALALALPVAKHLGISRVLVTCDADNVGSYRIIEANGGVLENEIIIPGSGMPKKRYWIDLA